MNRRSFLQIAAAAGAQGFVGGAAPVETAYATPQFEFAYASVAELRAAMASGKTTAAVLAEQFLKRIDAIDRAGPALAAVIETNPDAVAIARALDEERETKGPRGPLHGVPVLVKDNLDTHDGMMTTAGSLALVGPPAPQDSFVIQKLREAGAVILGKANLSEWANFRASPSTSGWSARGGLTKNPYALDRNPSGSSSGSAVAVAAGLCAVAVGTETNGSIISPATVCGVVGLKPTVGLVSRAGIIPISVSQDTAGPMGRSVRDVAVLLGAMAGADGRDPATAGAAEKGHRDYAQFLDAGGLKGARIGVPRQFFRGGGRGREVVEKAINAMKDAGAVVIDPVQMPGWNGLGGASYEVMLYEFKDGIDRYLQSRAPHFEVRSLDDLIAFNEKHAEKEMPYFGQEILHAAVKKGPLTEQGYLDAAERCRTLSRTKGIDAVMDEHKLDALVAPSGGPAGKTDLLYGDRDVGGSSSPAAVAGYPNITVPAGNVRGLPVGVSFFGRAWGEPVLLRLAHAFEQLTKGWKPPQFVATVG